MNIEVIREYCLMKKGVTEDVPFGNDVLAFRVISKMFVLASLNNTPLTINLKCDPTRAIELRESYEAVREGYHMNKKHWNTVTIDNSVPDREILSWIDHSYDLVVNGLKKAERDKLQ
jgi:predicted DNA-binding protein (MmcQ/YjbR family)